MASSSTQGPTKWKDVIISSLVTVLVSVCSGVAVYFFTRPPKEILGEKLIYQVNGPLSIQLKDVAYSSYQITLRNSGTSPSEGIQVMLAAIVPASILNITGTSSVGNTVNISRDTLGSGTGLQIDKLLPRESVSISLVIKGKLQSNLTVSAKTKNVIGSYDSNTISGTGQGDEASKPNSSRNLGPFGIGMLVLASSIIVLLSTQVLRRFFVRKVAIEEFENHLLNNAGFCLIHSGKYDVARNIYEPAISKGEFGPYMAMNMALIYHLDGENDKSQLFFKVAKMLSRGNDHPEAVVAFNEAIVDLKSERRTDALMKMQLAVRKSKTVLEWARVSCFFEEIRTLPEWQDLIGNDDNEV